MPRTSKPTRNIIGKHLEILKQLGCTTFSDWGPLKWNIPWQGLQLGLAATVSVFFRLLYS